MFTEEHEVVSFCHDPQAGLKAIIAIHSTHLGPALGGTRIFPYSSEGQALTDVLELSRAMTYKAAAAELPFGGAKAVLFGDWNDPEKEKKLKSFCRFINLFGGNFQTGEDVGTTPTDILFMKNFTRYAHCTPPGLEEHLQGSALTARGVLRGIEASLQYSLGSSRPKDRHIAIQGLGKVGYHLAKYLTERDARITVADINPDLVTKVCTTLNCESVEPSEIYSVECDVFAPCAMGQILNRETVSQLKAPIVAGCANNQLQTDEIANLLREKGILYAPDYVINSGGLISAILEMGIEDETKVLARVDAIGSRLLHIYSMADQDQCTTLEVADRSVKERLSRL
jgi:leucine dehydrogenase